MPARLSTSAHTLTIRIRRRPPRRRPSGRQCGGRPGRAGASSRSRSATGARAAAPIDIVGTWAQVTTEDWQWRYITPAKGDYTAVPLTAEANKIAQGWDPDADVKAGNQCKPFGAASVMRLPTRMQIAWVDDNTLKFDWDLGTQTRTVYFDKTKQPGARSLQGHAIAEWIDIGGVVGVAAAAAEAPVQLRVVRRRRLPLQQTQQLAVQAPLSRLRRARLPHQVRGVVPGRQVLAAQVPRHRPRVAVTDEGAEARQPQRVQAVSRWSPPILQRSICA